MTAVRKPKPHVSRKKVPEEQARKMRLTPGSIAPHSGQYTMTGTDPNGVKFRKHVTAVVGKPLPSGGPGTAGHKWRLTDSTSHARKKS